MAPLPLLAILLVGQSLVGQSAAAEPYTYAPRRGIELVEIAEVIVDLGLSSDQQSRLQEAEDRMDVQFEPRFQKLRRAHDPKADRDVFGAWEEAGDAAVRAALNPAQWERLRVLQYQTVGFRALLYPDLRARLALRPDQVAALDRLAKRDYSERCAGAFGTLIAISSSPREEARRDEAAEAARLEAARLEAAKVEAGYAAEALTLLDPLQRRAYLGLLGRRLPAIEGTASSVTVVTIG